MGSEGGAVGRAGSLRAGREDCAHSHTVNTNWRLLITRGQAIVWCIGNLGTMLLTDSSLDKAEQVEGIELLEVGERRL